MMPCHHMVAVAVNGLISHLFIVVYFRKATPFFTAGLLWIRYHFFLYFLKKKFIKALQHKC